METIILTTPEDLKKTIIIALSEYFKQNPNAQRTEFPDNLNMDDAVAFLKSSGYPTSKPRLYKLTAKNRIPFKKYGNKLIFSRKALLKWAQSLVTGENTVDEDVRALIESAYNKMA